MPATIEARRRRTEQQSGRAPIHWPIQIGILLTIEILFLWVALRSVSTENYVYDEADYMFAASQGLLANYIESPTLSMSEFVRAGLAEGPNPARRAILSERIRNSGDILFYRHWHGMAYFFALIPVAELDLDERGTRAVLLFIPVLAIAIVFLGILWLIPGVEGQAAALLAAALFAFSNTMLWNSELAPHKLFALFYLCSLLTFAKLIATGERRYWYAALVFTGIAICTLEVAFVLVATVLICGWVERERLHWDRRFALRSLATLVATVLIVWPGSLWKLSIVKAYAFMAYLGAYSRNAWGLESFPETWAKRFFTSPLEWLLIAAGIWIYIRHRDLPVRRLLYPFAVYGGLMILATIRITTGLLRYALPFQPALDVFAGILIASALWQWRPRLAYAGAAAIAVALAAGMLYEDGRHPYEPWPRYLELVDYVRQNHSQDKTLLVPAVDLPIVHYYFPGTQVHGYRDRLPSRQEIQQSGADAVILPDYPIRSFRAERPR